MSAESNADLTLSHEAGCWVVDQIVLGTAVATVVATLVEQGVDPDLAQREVTLLARSPAVTVAKAYAERARRLDLAVRLREEHSRFAPLVERFDGPLSLPQLHRAVAAARPFWIPGWASDWPSASWTWPALRERFGEGDVEVAAGRDGHARPDLRYMETATRMRFDAFLDRVVADGESNDVYLIAHNRGFQEPLLLPLIDDLRFPDVSGIQRNFSLWLGPRGTRTPLHHDRVDILFVQILGRKRFHLVDGMNRRLLSDCQTFWVDHDLAHPPDDVPVTTLELGPGDAIFLPCGTWHQVTSLEPSLSISTTSLGTPNEFGWYEPGGATRGPPTKATRPA